jgi:hypothetical protein
MQVNGLGPLLGDDGDPLPEKQLFALFKILGTRMTGQPPQCLAQFRTPGACFLGDKHAQKLQHRAEQGLGPARTAQLYEKLGLTYC